MRFYVCVCTRMFTSSFMHARTRMTPGRFLSRILSVHLHARAESGCFPCLEGYFAPEEGSVSCLKCASETDEPYSYGPQYTSSEGSSECALAARGHYMTTDGRSVSCEKGEVCTEEGTTLEEMQLEEVRILPLHV